MMSRTFLAASVLAHLAVSIVHGQAHDGAAIPMSRAANLFIYAVIVVGPLAGLALSWWRPAAGGWVVAAAMAGSLVFGIVNHYAIAGPDHVAHVAEPWRALFGTTAALLVVSELAGVVAGVACAYVTTDRGASAT